MRFDGGDPMTQSLFNLQGHRGARGLRPENTLPSFEVALDCGVTSIETDLHLTRDDVLVLCHDHCLSPRWYCKVNGEVAVDTNLGPYVREMSLTQVREFRGFVHPTFNPHMRQEATLTPLAVVFAAGRGMDPFAIPTLADLLEFAAAYAGPMGSEAGKTASQQDRAARVIFDLELKRVPGRPEYIGDGFDGESPGLLEQAVANEVRRFDLVSRTVVRSFDHRAVAAIKRCDPTIRTAVLVAGTAPVAPEQLVLTVGASIYCPDMLFVDAMQVRRLHEASVEVLPWTANNPLDWDRLLDCGVDGITTDEPDRLAEVLVERQIAY
jgi:glycerophosphoryl diester phosphodiesterase